MIPPPMAANIPSLRLATRHTGPPSREAMITAPITGRGSIPFSSSLDLVFFNFSCPGAEFCLFDLTLDPILLLLSLDSLGASCNALDGLLVRGGEESLLAGGGESKFGDFGDFGPSEGLLLPVSRDDCGVR